MYTSLDVLCARQPIFDDRNRIFGYELLYRSQYNVDKADFVDDDIATIELILNTCGSINDDEALVQFPLFFNLTRNLLFSDSFFPVDANKAIIEILDSRPRNVATPIFWRTSAGGSSALEFDCVAKSYAWPTQLSIPSSSAIPFRISSSNAWAARRP